MDPTLPDPALDRRDFARAITALAAGAALTSAAVADEPKPGGKAPIADEPKPAAKAPTLAEVNEQMIRLRFGANLTEEQIKRLTQRVQGQRATAEALKKIPLKNGDEPAFVFSVDN
jgi:uncharacterized coiled-coil protein SlyX